MPRVLPEPYRAGTFEKSGPRPSAIVGCAITASRSLGYGRSASIAVCTAVMTSPALGSRVRFNLFWMCPDDAWIIGQPWRIRHLDEVLGHICARQGVWKATGGQIIDWFKSHSA